MKTALHSVSYAGVWTGQHRLSLEGFLQKASDLGYDGVMLMAKRPHLSILDLDREARTRVRGLLKEKHLELACVGGYCDFSIGAERPEIPVLEMQIAYVTELARLAQDLGGDKVRIYTAYERPEFSTDQLWDRCVQAVKECARRAADFSVTIGVQNHHDLANHYEGYLAFLKEVDEPNCKAMFDAWALELHGSDVQEAVRKLAPYIVHTTVADYVRRPRFLYDSRYVNFERGLDVFKAVPVGEGEVNYRGFLGALKEIGYTGFVAYEMCSMLEGGGSEANLDRFAKRFLEYMQTVED